MQVRLEVTSANEPGRVFAFDEPSGFVFGRAADCTCRVHRDPTFSRHHFLLEINPPQVSIQDLGSLNGTRVNGQLLGGRARGVKPEDAPHNPPVPLGHGDLIEAGAYSFRLSIDGAACCVDCGRIIPHHQRRGTAFVAGAHLCLSCREAEKSEPAGSLAMSLDQRQRAELDAAGVVEDLVQSHLGEEEREPCIQGYDNLEQVGRGGCGVVYRARRTVDGQTVAIKTLLQTRSPHPRQVALFQREKHIAMQLHHPHIVECRRYGLWGSIHFLEMEYMDGGSAWDLMRRLGGRVPLEQALSIMLQSLKGLAYAHQARLVVPLDQGEQALVGVVHRDLKPSNILLSGTSGCFTAKVADFGLAKAFAAAGYTRGSLSRSGSFCGTPPYMAPEHLVDYRNLEPVTDVFEIAATFYELLTGHTVWTAPTPEELYRRMLEDRVLPIREIDPYLPVGLARVLDRALQRKPADRYPDAGLMLEALQEAL